MSWDKGSGHSPWGSPPGDGQRPNGPDGPWGPGGSRGPGGPGGPPDLDELIARLQAFLRGLLPSGFGGGPPRGPGLSRGLAGGRGLILIAVLLVGVWLASGFYRVQPDEQGVVLRFGA